MAIITLLTDFGTQDEYVGVLKGVILGVNPAATLVDITHEIAAQDVAGAAYTLAAAYTYFPEGSIHVVVVDPGVGSDRQIIGIRINGQLFLAPNNGVLSRVIDRYPIDDIVSVVNENYFRHPISYTFHGRDIFAPVAGHLSLGVELGAMGPRLPEHRIARLDTPLPKKPEKDDRGRLKGRIIAGEIIKVDRFGNLITNIHWRHMEPMLLNNKKDLLVIEVGERCIEGLAESYAHVPQGEPLAILGSRNCLEIAVRDGNAAEVLKLRRGDTVRIQVGTEGTCQE